ncbi:MAG: hypothetical protein KGR69_02460 [Verrucomicrobia bacterium]|nr:hypothetical protein [Verrucomicrobiota bacterium]
MSNPKSLTDDQVARIREWAEAGDGVPEIQKKLREELDLRVTYLDTRFLLEDLKIELKPTPEPEPEKADEADDDGDLDELGMDETVDSTAEGSGGVTLTVDTVLRPGAIISGRADFGGGQTASWWLDQMGRLGLDASDPGFRPTEEQAIAFQKELRKVIQKSGF